MRKYQYDDAYFVAAENTFLEFSDYEEEEAFARHLEYGKYQ